MKKCCETSRTPSHEKQLPRISRAVGQLEGIKRMITDGRYCIDIMMQFKAVKAAIKAVERDIFNTHLNKCVAESFANPKDRDEKIAEIQKLIEGM